MKEKAKQLFINYDHYIYTSSQPHPFDIMHLQTLIPSNTNMKFLLLSVILSIITVATAHDYNVCDTDGNPLVPGVQYYIVPGITNDAGGLTLESNNGSCPLNVAQSPNNGDLGLPVIFTIANPHKDLIGLGDNIYISFSTSMCAESTGWRITGPDEVSNRYHVSTSKYTGNPLQGTVDNWFRIEQYMNVYRLGFCPNECHDQCGIPQCGVLSVEVVECHRWLVLTGSNERCFPVQFKRA